MTFLHVLIKTSCFKETTTEPMTKRQICCRGSINFSMTTLRSSINIIVCKNELDHINLFDITTSPFYCKDLYWILQIFLPGLTGVAGSMLTAMS